MKKETLNWNKSLLIDEYDYIIRLINQRKQEVTGLDINNLYENDRPTHNLSEHHDVMSIVRLMVGKGTHIYRNKSIPIEQKQRIKKSLKELHSIFERLEQEGYY